MTTILINTQLTIVTYLIVGFFLSKTGLIDGQAQLFISNLTINVLLPASVFTSFLTGMSMDLLISLGTILILAILLEVFLSLASKIPSSRFTPSEACVAHYGYLVSNGGLIGTPVIESLFGPVGVMCCNVFMIPTRIMAFSAGESIFNPSLKRTPKAILFSILTNKILVVMALGLAMIGFHLSLPAPVLTALQKIGSCLAPFSLILVGSMLAQKVKLNAAMVKNVAWITLIRLLAIPLAALGICLLLHLDFQTTAVITLLMGMPVGSSCASFAKKYRGNEAFASAVVLISTLLSTMTLVLLMKLIELAF